MRLVIDAACGAWSHPSLPAVERVDLWETVARGSMPGLANSGLIVLGSRDRRAESSIQLTARIREQLPHVPIYVCSLPGESAGLELCDFAWAGADEVFILASESDWRGLGATVSRRLRCPVPEVPLRTLADELAQSDGRTILLWGLRSGWMQRGERAAADFFRMDTKTVNRRLDAIGGLRIGSVYRHSVLWHAATLRSTGEHDMRRIRESLGLADRRSLSKKQDTVKRQVGANIPGARLLGAIMAILE